MDSKDLLAENLRNSCERTLFRIEEMKEHAATRPTVRGGGHSLWILGHLAYIEALVIDSFMLGRENPLQSWEELFDGNEVPDPEEGSPEFDEVLRICRERRAETLELLASLTESDLDARASGCPDGQEGTFGTYRKCLQFVADHWYMHRGQLADARRAAGLERMWF